MDSASTWSIAVQPSFTASAAASRTDCPPKKLGVEARRIAGWLEQGRNVWAFFNNTDSGDAWRDAEKLVELVGKRVPEAVPSPGR